MVSRSNASKVIDIQDKIRTADGLSFNEPLKFTAKSSTIRSDKKRRGTKFNYLRIWIDRKSSIKISMMLFPETCSLKSRYIITLWRFCSTHIVSYIKSNVLWTIVNTSPRSAYTAAFFDYQISEFILQNS